VNLQSGDDLAAQVREATVAHDFRPMFEGARIHPRPIALQVPFPTRRKEVVQDRTTALLWP
jgi:hypothetical protein